MHSVGFEPTHPKILRPERSALDRSAKNAYVYGDNILQRCHLCRSDNCSFCGLTV